MQDREHEIGEIAHRLWQAAGEPHGLDTEHWRRAEEIWADESGPEPQTSDEPFGEPAEPTLAVTNQALPRGLDDQTERTVAPRRQRQNSLRS